MNGSCRHHNAQKCSGHSGITQCVVSRALCARAHLCDADDGRDAIDREEHVGELDADQYDKHGRCAPHAVDLGEELVAVVLVGRGDELASDLHHLSCQHKVHTAVSGIQ